jgi:hypothetical protein
VIYETPEPLEIPRNQKRFIDRDALDAFWSSAVALDGTELRGAVGCYVFSIESGRGILPWYVGRATRQPFHRECFAHHKLTHYHETLGLRERGTPRLTLFAKFTPTGRLAKPSSEESAHRDVAFLEKYLIGLCIRRNPKLRNIRDAAYLRQMKVPGVINSPRGKPSMGVQALKRLLGELV